MVFSMIRPHPYILRTSLSAAARGRTTTAVGCTSRRHHCFHPTNTTIASCSYHATTATHHSGDERPSSRTSWSDLIASRTGRDPATSEATGAFERPSWSEEWKRLGLGAELVEDNGSNSNSKYFPRNLFFVQLGFGVDQHGDRQSDGFATKAAIRAVRNAIEFNSIPGVIDHLPGGRKNMLIHVKLGVPAFAFAASSEAVDALEVAKVFPYGRLLPIEVVKGGLEFHSGRVVEELGDDDDVGICCVACVSIGYNKNDDDSGAGHKTFNTKDGY
jgi:uncharacterized protein (TIGR02058 family)